MATVLRFFMSLIVHLAWQRLGKGAPIPRLRTPKGKTVVLPTIAPWQIMAATWLIKKAWSQYGHGVKSRLDNVDNHWVKQAGGLLPDPPGYTAPDPGQAAAAPPPPATTTHPAPQYGTQVLPTTATSSQPATTAQPATPGSSNPLPAGSVLNGLRQSPGTNG